MNDPLDFSAFTKISRNVSLTNEERNGMRTRLLTAIHTRPVGLVGRVRIKIQKILTSLTHPVTGFSAYARVFTGFVILLGGGTSAAAEQSLPGDWLYQVKVGLNEEVRGALVFSEDAKIRWETERVSRRLEEAEILATANRLTEHASSLVEANFQTHAERVQERLRNLESRNIPSSFALNANYEASLKAHEQVLTNLAAQQERVDSGAERLRHLVSSESERASQERKKADERLVDSTNNQLKTSAASRQRTAENTIKKTAEIMARLNRDGIATPEVALRLLDAEKKVTEGKTMVAQKKYREAISLFGTATILATEAGEFGRTAERLQHSK